MSSRLPESRYIHGTSPSEQARLALMNHLMNPPALRELALGGGERILDVGSGLGLLTREMARAVGPTGRVLGVEASTEQIQQAERLARADGEAGLLELRQGDARALPLSAGEWGSFDIAHTRFLLEHVPDPLAVVEGMVRAVRPGGRVVLQDDAHDIMRLEPEPPGFNVLWESYWQSYRDLGNDPLVGHRLVSLLHQAGAAPSRATWIFFGACAGDPAFASLVDNTLAILDGARATVLAAGRISAEACTQTLRALADFRQRPDAAMWYAISWAEGMRPRESL